MYFCHWHWSGDKCSIRIHWQPEYCSPCVSNSPTARLGPQPLLWIVFIHDSLHPRTGHEGPEWVTIYGSTLSLTSALDRGGWSTIHTGLFTAGRATRYPLHRTVRGREIRVYCNNYTFWRLGISHIITFPRVAREPAHNNGCGPLSQKDWSPML
jgi:hypothetical protein